MPKKEVVRKKFRVDPEKLARAKAFLGAESDTETINKALDQVLRGAPPVQKSKAPRRTAARTPKSDAAIDAKASAATDAHPVDNRPSASRRPDFAPKSRSRK